MCSCGCVFQVFIEFESTFDADWLGVWHSLLKQAPDLEIHRQKIPSGPCTSLGMILEERLFFTLEK